MFPLLATTAFCWALMHGICVDASYSSPIPYTTRTSTSKMKTAKSSSLISSSCAATVTLAYSSFVYTQESTNRYPTPLPSPLSYATPFAPPFSVASTLLPAHASYTTYSLNPNGTASADGKYGQSAYAAMWASYSYRHTVPFTTTASATPVATSELVFPPALYAGTGCPTTQETCSDCYNLPSTFVWGVSGSAWQIEGGLQSEGRGPCYLDSLGNLLSPYTASLNDSVVADMNYFLYEQDIARIAALGIPHYSFSISWSRIVPFGVAGSPINQQALSHYDDVINKCIQYGVTPIVTLWHYDAPVSIQPGDKAAFRAAFLYYAKQVMTHYGDRVPYWVTYNQPNSLVPGLYSGYNTFTNLLLAHADVYKWYKNELNGTGQITIKFSNRLALPLDPSNADDVAAAARYQDFILGIMCNPLFLGVQYPSDVLNTPGVNLTGLTKSQLTYINGSIDFLSLDAYTSQFATAPPVGVSACSQDSTTTSWPTCAILSKIQSNGWLMGDSSNDGNSYIEPQYVRQQLGYLWNTFRPSGILLAEFGFNVYGESAKSLNMQRYDLERTLYFQEYLREMLKARTEDGVNVIGALAWSALDNNEFGSYANMYGLQTVDRTSGLFERTYKRSIFDFVDFFNTFMEQ